VMNYHRPTI